MSQPVIDVRGRGVHCSSCSFIPPNSGNSIRVQITKHSVLQRKTCASTNGQAMRSFQTSSLWSSDQSTSYHGRLAYLPLTRYWNESGVKLVSAWLDRYDDSRSVQRSRLGPNSYARQEVRLFASRLTHAHTCLKSCFVNRALSVSSLAYQCTLFGSCEHRHCNSGCKTT